MKITPHNKLIKKLIDKGWGDEQIRVKIKKEFGIYFSLAQINAKRSNELNQLIKPYKQDAKELLYPSLYTEFPKRQFIKHRLDRIINYLLESIDTIEGFPSEDVLIELLLAFERELNTYKHEAYLYSLIYLHKKHKNQSLNDSKSIRQLKELISNPFKNFFSLSNLNHEHISFKADSPEFDNIVREVCRDNIITKNERSYLEEKASEYFIDPDKLERYLDNPFFGYETFKMFVDQICEDGVITDIERVYIQEKSEQYNVSSDVMNEMIRDGLVRSSLLKQLRNSRDFYDITLIYLIAHAFGIPSTMNSIYEALNSGELNSKDQLKSLKFSLLKRLKKRLSLKSYYLGNWNDLNQFFDILNIGLTDFEEANSRYITEELQVTDLSENQRKSSIETIQEKIYIGSLKIDDVEITKTDKTPRAFDVNFHGSKMCITYSSCIDEIVLVKALSVLHLNNSRKSSKTDIIKQINRVLDQLIDE